MNQAALLVYQGLRKNGTQKDLISKMQTREELYEFLNYHEFEKKLDKLFDYNDVLYMQYIHKDIVSDVGKSNLEIFAYSNKIKNMGMIKKNHILTL